MWRFGDHVAGFGPGAIIEFDRPNFFKGVAAGVAIDPDAQPGPGDVLYYSVVGECSGNWGAL